MKIFVLKKDTLEKLKTIPYEGVYKESFNKGLFTDLYGIYDSDSHVVVALDSLPDNRKLVDGEVEEMTDYECYVEGTYELSDGEYADEETESIVTVECPNSTYYKWDSDEKKWTISDENLTAWKTALKSELATLKYTKQESATVSSDSLTNLTASYNYLLMKDAIETYEEGISVRWTNLDDKKIDITDDLYTELISLRTQTRTHYQACFNAKEDVEKLIDSYTADEMLVISLTDLWNENYSS